MSPESFTLAYSSHAIKLISVTTSDLCFIFVVFVDTEAVGGGPKISAHCDTGSGTSIPADTACGEIMGGERGRPLVMLLCGQSLRDGCSEQSICGCGQRKWIGCVVNWL